MPKLRGIQGSDFNPPKFVQDDGGRAEAGYKGSAGDCVVRAIAIAAQLPYQEVYDTLFEMNKEFAVTSRSRAAKVVRRDGATPRNGNFYHVYHKYILSLGFDWVPTTQVGQGMTHHVKSDELPSGRLILRLSKHLAAFIDGVLRDTYDCSREGKRGVYGYYIKREA